MPAGLGHEGVLVSFKSWVKASDNNAVWRRKRTTASTEKRAMRATANYQAGGTIATREHEEQGWRQHRSSTQSHEAHDSIQLAFKVSRFEAKDPLPVTAI